MDVALVVLAGLTQIVLTWYGVHVSVKEYRIRNAVIIFFVGLAGVVFMGWGAYRSGESQKQLQGQILAIKQKLEDNQPALVGLFDIFVWPKQELVADTKVPVQIRYLVKEGFAKNYRVWEELLTLKGKPSSYLDRQAIAKFRQDSIGKLDYKGEDKVQGTGSQRTLYITLGKTGVKEVFAESRMIYVVARIEWNNPAGADFHTEICSWMEHPTENMIDHLGWHVCHP